MILPPAAEECADEVFYGRYSLALTCGVLAGKPAMQAKLKWYDSSCLQDNPLMDAVVEQPGTPILGLDNWEHAY